MLFSLFYFTADSGQGTDGAEYRLLMDGARFADEHDFTAVWTPERHFHRFGGLYPNPSVTSAAVAAVTRRVSIRAGSVVLPLHHPVRLVEEWAVVDRLSRGRVGLSLAPGANPTDFLLSGADYGQRKAQTVAGIDVLRKLWSGQPYHDPRRDVDVTVLPRPVQPTLPLWLTCGGSEQTFVDAGRAGTGVLTHLMSQSHQVLRDNLARYRDNFVSVAGTRPHVTLMVHAFVGESDEAARDVATEPLADYLVDAMGMLTDNDRLDPARARLAVRSAVQRYLSADGLIGSVATCAQRVAEFAELGVDELACLLDFGIADQTVLDGLARLDLVRQRTSNPAFSR